MGGTTGSTVPTSGASRNVAVVPRFDETIAPEFYRQSGKIRTIAMVMMMLLYGAQRAGLDQFSVDEPYARALWLASLPLMVGDIVLSVVLWRRSMSSSAARRLSMVCVVIECGLVLVNMQAVGSVNSHLVPAAVLLVVIYRLAFDFGIGALGLTLFMVGHWAIVGAEALGWVEPQPLASVKDAVYALPARELGAMLMIAGIYVIGFLFANWAVARMRHKEIALRLLRESLYLHDPGKVGRDTGRTLGGTYTVGALIGVGGMGTVYRGEHLRTHRAVAIKLLHPHLVDDPGLLKRFRREAEIVGAVASQHVVEVIDVDDDDGQPFLVLELLTGESLRDRIAARGPLPTAMVGDLAAQVASGLAAAHGAGIIHRDLKPENVFICPRDRGGETAKILDFGISKIRGAATALTHEVALLGTPDFMAPEQAIGKTRDVDVHTDVYALGALTYCMLTGRPPFVASSVPALLRRVCDDEPIAASTLRPELPARVDAVLGRAMAKRPSERYADVRAFARDLSDALGIAHGMPEPAAVEPAPSVPRTNVAEDAFSKTLAASDHGPGEAVSPDDPRE
jgi:serine/threonine protein kinase